MRREEEAKSKPISKTAFVIECTVAKSAPPRSNAGEQKKEEREKEKELRLFADDGLAGHGHLDGTPLREKFSPKNASNSAIWQDLLCSLSPPVWLTAALPPFSQLQKVP